MDEYVVGSVANLISSKNIPEIYLKKEKVKLKKGNQGTNVTSRTDNPANNTTKVKKKNKDGSKGISSVEYKADTLTNNTSKVRKKKKDKVDSNVTHAECKTDIAANNISKVKIMKKTKDYSKEISSLKCKPDPLTNNIIKVKPKKKNKDGPSDNSVQNLYATTKYFETPEENTENMSSQIMKKSLSKKRKRLSTVDDGEVLKQKKSKNDLFNEDHIPSDSENEEIEKLEKNSKEIEKLSKKQIETKNLNENTVFIGNIPINYDKQKICKAFSKFGEIQNARIRCIPIGDINMSKKVAAIKRKFNPKRNSLVAYVNFKSLDSAKAAVEANGMVIDGHHLRVDFADSNKEKDNNKAVFVGGLPFDIEDDELWVFFQNCGTIISVRVIRDSQTSMGKGFGYVNFDSTAAVELALQMNGQELKKRAINVKRCVNVRKKDKFNTFGRQKSKEMANQLLCKRGKKFKEEKKKFKKENKKFSTDFQGRTANMKLKKKKKLSKAALRQRKLVKVLGTTS